MGVDIYGYAEVSVTGRWEFAGDMVPNPEHKYAPEEPEWMPEEFFSSSSKKLAAILTDTGNPIRSSEPYTPVTSPRGLPLHLSPELAAWFLRPEGEPAFPANWFLAREAIEFGWNERIMRRRAMVAPEVAHLFAGCPRGFPWARWPSGIPIRYASWSRNGVEVEWLESYAEFVRDVLPRLNALGEPGKVRLVVAAYC